MIVNTRYFVLIELLNSFTTKELDDFQQFLESPFFNTDLKIKKLYSLLQSQIKKNGAFTEVAQSRIYYQLFENQTKPKPSLTPKQKKTLVTKMSVLTQLAKKFLTIQGLEEEEGITNRLLYKKLLDKRQFRLFERLTKKDKQTQAIQIAKGVEDYEQAFYLEMKYLDYLYQTGSLLKQNNFPVILHNLDMYYLLQKLKLNITMQSIKNVTRQEFDFSTIEALGDLLTHPTYKNHPSLLIIQVVIELTQTNQEATFLKLLELLALHSHQITKQDLLDYYTVALNYCARQVRGGNVKYNQQSLDLFKTMDEKEVLLEEGFIDIIRIKNMVYASCGVQDFTWATTTLSKYLPFVKKEWQTNVHQYNLGVIAFFRKQYKTAISHFIRVEKVHPAYDIDGRMLLLKSHFLLDNDYDERSMRIFRSAEHFIQQNPALPLSHKKSYKNFIQILINLYRVKHKVGKRTVESVQTKLDNMKIIGDKKWLTNQLQKL